MEIQRPGQVQVHFVTDSPDIELPEDKRQLLVPTSVRRYGLSQILNSESMLDTESPIPLDFIVNGEYLRTSLEEYLAANGLSSETTLTLRYVRSLVPPLFQASFEHDDWVSSVDVLSTSSVTAAWSKSELKAGGERIISASYDGLVRVWNTSGQAIATSPSVSLGGHSAGVKSVKFVSPTQVASAGLDRSIRLWKYTETDDGFSAELKPTMELYGHKAAVDHLAVHAPSRRVLSASADGKVGVWSTSKADAPAAPETLLPNSASTSNKRRKLSSQLSTPQRGALAMMDIHHGPVSAAIFDPRDATVAYSVSQDHTVKTIDLTTATVVDTRTTSHPLLCLASLAGDDSSAAPLLAAGTTARHITLVDPRVSSATTAVLTLRGHTNKVASIARAPRSSYSLVSGSHDGTCRVWDLRSTRAAAADEGGGGRVSEPVYIIERESAKVGSRRPVAGDGIKVFGVAWDADVGIVSAGEDKMVQINRGRDLIADAA